MFAVGSEVCWVAEGPQHAPSYGIERTRVSADVADEARTEMLHEDEIRSVEGRGAGAAPCRAYLEPSQEKHPSYEGNTGSREHKEHP